MTQILPAAGRLIHSTKVGDRMVELYEDTGPENLGFVGYIDGERSVSAVTADMAIRGLSRKLSDDLPTAEIINLFG